MKITDNHRDIHLPIDQYYESYISKQFRDHVAVVGTMAWMRNTNDILRKIDPHERRPSDQHREITHGTLMKYVNSMSAFIRRKYTFGVNGECNITRNAVIPIYLGRTIDTVVAMLAVVRAGAAFVLLDDVEIEEDEVVASGRFKQYLSSVNPNDEIKAEGISIKYVLTTREKWRERYEQLHAPATVEPIYLDECESQIRFDAEMVSFSESQQLGYVVYSSGTTGKPKGVLIPNSGLVSRVLSHTRFLEKNGYLMGSDDKVPVTAPLRFDASIMQILLGLFCGGQVHVIEEQTRVNNPSLYQYFQKYNMTAAILVPSQWRAFNDHAPLLEGDILPNLRVIVSTGEAFDKKLISRWITCGKMNRLLVNGYGPSETTVGLTLYLVEGENQHQSVSVEMGQVKKQMDLISVGEPMLGTKLLVVEPQDEYSGPLKVIAELAYDSPIKIFQKSTKENIIDGEIIALDVDGYRCRSLGYINEPRKNRLNFISLIQQPVKSGQDNEYVVVNNPDGIAAYRTGDKSTVIDGKLYVLSRYVPNQLKKYGQLVNVEEIQGVLTSYIKQGRYPVFSSTIVSHYVSGKSLAVQFVVYLNNAEIPIIKYHEEAHLDLRRQAEVFFAIDTQNNKIRLYRDGEIVAENYIENNILNTLERLDNLILNHSKNDVDNLADLKSEQQKLVRYLVFPKLAESNDEELYISLRDYAKRFLYTYMLPSRWIVSAVSEKGKADVTKLPDWKLTKIYRTLNSQADAVADIAKCVRDSWSAIFDDIQCSNISSNSKFDELGGDSFAYTLMLNELRCNLVQRDILKAVDFSQDLRLKLFGTRNFSEFVDEIYRVQQSKNLPKLMTGHPIIIESDIGVRDENELNNQIRGTSADPIYFFHSPFAMQNHKTGLNSPLIRDLTLLYSPLIRELTLRRPVIEVGLASDYNPVFGGHQFKQQLAFIKPKIIAEHLTRLDGAAHKHNLILVGHSAGGMLAYRMAQEIGNAYPCFSIKVIMLDTTSSQFPRKIELNHYIDYVQTFIGETVGSFYGLLQNNNISQPQFSDSLKGITSIDINQQCGSIEKNEFLDLKMKILMNGEKYANEILDKVSGVIATFKKDLFSIQGSDTDIDKYIDKVLLLYKGILDETELERFKTDLVSKKSLAVSDLSRIVSEKAPEILKNINEKIEYMRVKFVTMFNFCKAELNQNLEDVLPKNVKVFLMTSFVEYPNNIKRCGFTRQDQYAYLLWDNLLIEEHPTSFSDIRDHSHFIADSSSGSLRKVARKVEDYLGLPGEVRRLLRLLWVSRLQAESLETECYVEPQCTDEQLLKNKVIALLQDRNNSERKVKSKSILITGDAGMGKTVFSLNLVSDLMDEHYRSGSVMPIYIDLKEACAAGFLSQKKGLLNTVIAIAKAKYFLNIDITEEDVVNYIKRNDLIYIIDGCDEVPQNMLEYILEACLKGDDGYHVSGKIRQVIFTCREEALLGFSSEFVQAWFSTASQKHDDFIEYKQLRMVGWRNSQIKRYLKNISENRNAEAIISKMNSFNLDYFDTACQLMPEFVELIRAPLLLRMIAPKLPEIVDKLLSIEDSDSKKATISNIYAYFFIEWILREEAKIRETDIKCNFKLNGMLGLYSALYTINLAISIWRESLLSENARSLNEDISEDTTLNNELLSSNLHATCVLQDILEDASVLCPEDSLIRFKRALEEIKVIQLPVMVDNSSIIPLLRSCSMLNVTSYREVKFKFIHKSIIEYIIGTGLFNKLQLLALEAHDIVTLLRRRDQAIFINGGIVRDQPNIVKIIKMTYPKGSRKTDDILRKLWMYIDLSRHYEGLEQAASNAATLISAIDPLYFCNKDLSNTKMPDALFVEAFFHHTNFNYTDLSRARFIKSDFFGATFLWAKLSESLAEAISKSGNASGRKSEPATVMFNNEHNIDIRDSRDLLALRFVRGSWFAAHCDGNLYRLGDDLKKIDKEWAFLADGYFRNPDILRCLITDSEQIFCVVNHLDKFHIFHFEIPMNYSQDKLHQRSRYEIAGIEKITFVSVDPTGQYFLLQGDAENGTVLRIYRILLDGSFILMIEIPDYYNDDFGCSSIDCVRYSYDKNQVAFIYERSNILITIDLSIDPNPNVKIAEFLIVDSKLQARSFTLDQWRDDYPVNVIKVEAVEGNHDMGLMPIHQLVLCSDKIYLKTGSKQIMSVYQLRSSDAMSYDELDLVDKRNIIRLYHNYLRDCRIRDVEIKSISYAYADTDIFCAVKVSNTDRVSDAEIVFSRYNIEDNRLSDGCLSALSKDSSFIPGNFSDGSFDTFYDPQTKRVLYLHNERSHSTIYLIDENLVISSNLFVYNNMSQIYFSSPTTDAICTFALMEGDRLSLCRISMKTGQIMQWPLKSTKAIAVELGGSIYSVIQDQRQILVSELSLAENQIDYKEIRRINETGQNILSVNILTDEKKLVMNLSGLARRYEDVVAMPLQFVCSRLRIVDEDDWRFYRDSTRYDKKDVYIRRKNSSSFFIQFWDGDPIHETELFIFCTDNYNDDFVCLLGSLENQEIRLNIFPGEFRASINQYSSGSYCDDNRLFFSILMIIESSYRKSIINKSTFDLVKHQQHIIHDPRLPPQTSAASIVKNSVSYNESSDMLLLYPEVPGGQSLLSSKQFSLVELTSSEVAEAARPPLVRSLSYTQPVFICNTAVLRFADQFIPIILLNTVKSSRAKDTYVSTVYYSGVELKLMGHKYERESMSQRWSGKAFDFALSNVRDNSFYLTLYKTLESSPLWCYRLSKNIHNQLQWQKQDLMITQASPAEIQSCLPSIKTETLFYVCGGALYVSFMRATKDPIERMLAYQTNSAICSISFVGLDEKKLLVLTQNMVYIFSVSNIHNRCQIELFWVYGEHQPNFRHSIFRYVYCDNSVVQKLRSLLKPAQQEINFCSTERYTPCSSHFFKNGVPKLKLHDQELYNSVVSSKGKYTAHNALITVFYKNEAFIGKSWKPKCFTVEYVLNDKAFVMLYSFHQDEKTFSCVDISVKPVELMIRSGIFRKSSDITDLNLCMPVNHVLSDDSVTDGGLNKALRLESYVHGTLMHIRLNQDINLEFEWINRVLSCIGLRLDKMQIVPSNDGFSPARFQDYKEVFL